MVAYPDVPDILEAGTPGNIACRPCHGALELKRVCPKCHKSVRAIDSWYLNGEKDGEGIISIVLWCSHCACFTPVHARKVGKKGFRVRVGWMDTLNPKPLVGHTIYAVIRCFTKR